MPISKSQGWPEGKEEKQETEKLFEKLMTNLAKQMDIQVQEAQSPKQVGPKEDHTKTCHN